MHLQAMKIKHFVVETVLLIVLSVVAGCSLAQPGEVRQNCRLENPPDSSGEDASHGGLLKGYPRKSEITSAYDGCQTVWAQDDGRWVSIMEGMFEQGRLTRMRFPSRPGDAVEQCLKKAGRLLEGDSNVCRAMDAFPYSSAAPGCLTSSIGKTSRDNDCPYD